MTREEIIEAIQHDNTMPFLQDWEARDVVDFVLKNIHPSLPEGLEEAAEQYARDYTENDEGNGGDDWEDDIRITFIAGAKWDRNQMLKEAVECETVCIKDRLLAVLPMKEFRWTVGDKVRIIIVKE